MKLWSLPRGGCSAPPPSDPVAHPDTQNLALELTLLAVMRGGGAERGGADGQIRANRARPGTESHSVDRLATEPFRINTLLMGVPRRKRGARCCCCCCLRTPPTTVEETAPRPGRLSSFALCSFSDSAPRPTRRPGAFFDTRARKQWWQQARRRGAWPAGKWPRSREFDCCAWIFRVLLL